jgi:hypothetical protein
MSSAMNYGSMDTGSRQPEAEDALQATQGRMPIFICGIMPRSGTNLLASALGLHPNLEVCPAGMWEFPHFRHTDLLNEYAERIARSPKAVDFESHRFLRHVGDAWLSYMHADVARGKRIVLKDPSVHGLSEFFTYFPQALLLIIIRDGRDLVASAIKSDFVLPRVAPFQPGHWRRLFGIADFRILCRQYADSARTIDHFLQSDGRGEHARQIKVVKYESLVANRHPVLKEILVWAGLDPSLCDRERLQDLPVRGSSFLRGQHGEKVVPRPSEFNPVGRWRQWSKWRRRTFDRLAGPSMRRLGYDCAWDC